jgi:methyltransferase family protein
MHQVAVNAYLARHPERLVRRVGNGQILLGVVAGAIRALLLGSGATRHRLLKNIWIELKRAGSSNVGNIELSRIQGIEQVSVTGPVSRHGSLVLCALAALLDCRAVFEFGTYRGETSWLLARNVPSARVFTLDLPGPEAARDAVLELTDDDAYFTTWERGARFRGTPEASRITQLLGDSATFDFSPYSGAIDLVYVDASHSYSYAKSDSDAAFGMLSERGTIVWDDYTHYPGVYAYLNEIAPSLDRPLLHILGTRLAVYSRADILGDDLASTIRGDVPCA